MNLKKTYLLQIGHSFITPIVRKKRVPTLFRILQVLAKIIILDPKSSHLDFSYTRFKNKYIKDLFMNGISVSPVNI